MNKAFPWQQIETIIFDLDGTLIDLALDHVFWAKVVPQAYANKFNLTEEQSIKQLKQRYDAIEHRMQWYCIDFWAENLNLPLRELLIQHVPNIQVREQVFPFLTQLRAMGKQLILLTDSHPFSLQLKLQQVPLAQYFDVVLSSHQFSAPKVEQALWQRLLLAHPFEPKRCLLIDDTEKVLDSAAQFGIAYTLGIENPDSSLPENKHFLRHPSCQDFLSLLGVEYGKE